MRQHKAGVRRQSRRYHNLDSDPTDEPLPGYKKVQPMVYCGIYPAEGEKYENVKDALEKLQVNDAAFISNRKRQRRWDLDSDADSWGCFTWRSSWKVWSGNSTWQ